MISKLEHFVSGLYPLQFDRGDVLGVILAQQRSSSSKSGSGSDHSANNDNSHGQRQCCLAKDFLHEVHRYLSRKVQPPQSLSSLQGSLIIAY